ncbi:MAG: hypothetical protein ACRC4O_10875 [Giesbergeria sp.]
MTPLDLMKACTDARAKGLDRLTLKLLNRRTPRSNRIRLLGRAGPLVDVVGSLADGTLIVSAVALEVEAWLRRNAPEMPHRGRESDGAVMLVPPREWLACPSCGRGECMPDRRPVADYGYPHWRDGDECTCRCGARVMVSCDSECPPYLVELQPSPEGAAIRIARRARRRALLRRIREDRRPTGGRWYGREMTPRTP